MTLGYVKVTHKTTRTVRVERARDLHTYLHMHAHAHMHNVKMPPTPGFSPSLPAHIRELSRGMPCSSVAL